MHIRQAKCAQIACCCMILQALLRVNATSLASFVTLLSSGNSLPLLEPLKLVTSVANLTTSAWQQLGSSIDSVIDAVIPSTASGAAGINLGSMGNVAGIVAGEFDAILNNLNNLKISAPTTATPSVAAQTADASTAYFSAGEPQQFHCQIVDKWWFAVNDMLCAATTACQQWCHVYTVAAVVCADHSAVDQQPLQPCLWVHAVIVVLCYNVLVLPCCCCCCQMIGHHSVRKTRMPCWRWSSSSESGKGMGVMLLVMLRLQHNHRVHHCQVGVFLDINDCFERAS